MRILPVVGLYCVAVWISPAAAEEFTGKVLFNLCIAPASSSESALCSGYISGFTNAIQVEEATIKGGYACLPINFTGLAAQEIFIRAMKDHPDLGRLNAEVVLGSSLSHAFPCKSS